MTLPQGGLRDWLIAIGYHSVSLADDNSLFTEGKVCPGCDELIHEDSGHCRKCAQVGNQNARKTDRQYFRACVGCGKSVSRGSKEGRCHSCASKGNQNAYKDGVYAKVK